MSDRNIFKPPELIEEDISWAAALLELPENAFCGEDGTDPRKEVFTSIDSIDVAACPGSGKTTLLVAKLAILAEKWQHRTRGICVLSHTNAARYEIEKHLGKTAAGQQLLGYPHYIGTIHRFINEFLAVPWLRSQGYPIKMVDTEVCKRKRWYFLRRNTRDALEHNGHNSSVLSVKTPDFGVGEVRWGKKRRLGKDTPTYRCIQKACRESAVDGFFCHDEMFMWAEELMKAASIVIDVLRERFPLLFIDEAQDNSESQSTILHKIFLDGRSAVIRQRFGDPNQAIYDFVGAKETTTDQFPNSSVKNLPNSHRFGQKIADLADPLGIAPYGLVGQGFKSSVEFDATYERHTIFLFDDNSVDQVLDAYAKLLLDTFSEEQLRLGSFTAVGQVHRPTSGGNNKFPRHLGHYWQAYDPYLTRRDPVPRTFVEHIMAGQAKAQVSGESRPVVENVADGILRLAGMREDAPPSHKRRNLHRHVMRLLNDKLDVRSSYEDLIYTYVVNRELPDEQAWRDHWCGVVREISETISEGALTSEEVEDFLAWPDILQVDEVPDSIRSPNQDNVYRYPDLENPKVQIRIGSIHSIKGETHTATLVCETFWYAHNLEKLEPWITGKRSGYNSDGVQQRTRLKTHYVAMTRPTHLLCLAMKRSAFESNSGDLDPKDIEKLEQRGWQIKYV